MVFEPAWSLNVHAAPPTDRVLNSVYWYRMGEEFGFADLEGNVAVREKILFDATLRDVGYINFSRIPKNLVFRDNRGNFLKSFRLTGYPMLDKRGQRLFLLNSESTGLKVLNVESEESWTIEFPTLITSLCFSDDRILLGLLNGLIKVYNNGGELIGDYLETGSRVPIILGCAISPNGKDIIALSGIDPQKLLLIRTKEPGKAETFTMDLTSDYRREVFLRFSESGRLVYFESSSGLGIFELASKRVTIIPFQGSLIGLAESGHNGIMSILYKTDHGVELRVCTTQGMVLYSKFFECEFTHLRHIDDHILLGCDETLLRVDMVEQ